MGTSAQVTTHRLPLLFLCQCLMQKLIGTICADNEAHDVAVGARHSLEELTVGVRGIRELFLWMFCANQPQKERELPEAAPRWVLQKGMWLAYIGERLTS